MSAGQFRACETYDTSSSFEPCQLQACRASRMSSCAPTSYASATIAIARWLSPCLGNVTFDQNDGFDPDLPSAIVHIVATSASDPPDDLPSYSPAVAAVIDRSAIAI